MIITAKCNIFDRIALGNNVRILQFIIEDQLGGTSYGFSLHRLAGRGKSYEKGWVVTRIRVIDSPSVREWKGNIFYNIPTTVTLLLPDDCRSSTHPRYDTIMIRLGEIYRREINKLIKRSTI